MERSKGALCLKLFLKFLKIGAFTFGGGYAMIPLIRREIALREGWIEDKDILDILAVSESTPGPIAVNTATFVGYRVAGPLGAACATVGVVLPSFVIIFALSFVLRQFEDFPAVRYAFWGIRVAVVALVLSALVSMAKECPWNIVSYLLAAGAFVLVGLLGNIRWHRYDWTNETVVIKQSLGAMLPVLVSMLTTLPVVYFLAVAEDANALMGAITLALVAIDLFLAALLRKKAGRWYASL